MNAGSMDRRIRLLQEQETGRSPSGERILSWLTVATLWAERVPVGRSESYRSSASQVVATTDCVFRVRYRSGVDVTMRLQDLRDGERLYDIKGCSEYGGRRRGLEILAHARAEGATP